MPVIVGDNFTVRVFCRANDAQNMVNVLHYQVTQKTGVGTGDEQALATSLSGKLATIYKGFLPGTSRYEGIQMQRDSLLVTAATISSQGNGPGSGGIDALAPQLSELISWRSAGAPIGTRGRTYLPAGSENHEDTNGKLTPAAIIQFNGVGSSLMLITGVGIGGADVVELTLYIRRNTAGAISRHLVTNGILRNAFATQRRRSYMNRSDVNPF